MADFVRSRRFDFDGDFLRAAYAKGPRSAEEVVGHQNTPVDLVRQWVEQWCASGQRDFYWWRPPQLRRRLAVAHPEVIPLLVQHPYTPAPGSLTPVSGSGGKVPWAQDPQWPQDVVAQVAGMLQLPSGQHLDLLELESWGLGEYVKAHPFSDAALQMPPSCWLEYAKDATAILDEHTHAIVRAYAGTWPGSTAALLESASDMLVTGRDQAPHPQDMVKDHSRRAFLAW